jgi:hypothetical protein
MTTKRYVQDGRLTHCVRCGLILTPRQRYNHNRFCSRECCSADQAERAAPTKATACKRCGKPLPETALRDRRYYCRNSACGVSDTPPIPIVAPEPAQRVTAVLGREGGYTYRDTGDGWVSREGRGTVTAQWERRSNWHEGLPAYRRCHRPTPDEVIFDEVRVGPRAWRRYPLEVEV